jgi:hypothetical protein
MPGKQKLKVYTVQRFDWFYNDEYQERFGNGTAVKTFRDRARAEEYRLREERKLRRSHFPNPFAMMGLGLESQTSLSLDEFREAIRKLGLYPPERAWDCYDWWEQNKDDLTPEQEDALWGLLDQVRLLEVVETEIEVEP